MEKVTKEQYEKALEVIAKFEKDEFPEMLSFQEAFDKYIKGQKAKEYFKDYFFAYDGHKKIYEKSTYRAFGVTYENGYSLLSRGFNNYEDDETVLIILNPDNKEIAFIEENY